MPRLLKSLFLSLILLLGSLFIPSLASASPQEFIKAVQEGNNLQWYLGGSSGMLATTADSLFTTIVGAYEENGQPLSDGAIKSPGKMMAFLYKNKPASTPQYLAYVLNHSGIAKSAYAQGSGWDFLTKNELTGGNLVDKNGISPILRLWEIARNTTYVFFIVIFVAIGFMIMFRSKLNPQTAVSVQMALPGIIVSLILVTFSFAISGFIIDFVFLGHNLLSFIYFGGCSLTSPLSSVVSGDYLNAVKSLDVFSALFGTADPTNPSWADVSGFSQLGSFLTGVADTLGRAASGNTVTLVSTILPLIFAFTLLGTGLKIFFALITKYVTLILSTIFSPFVFLFSAFPGKNTGIGNFLKTMLSSALAFPATAFMFYLSAYFVSSAFPELNGLPPLNKAGVLTPGSMGSISFGGRILEPLIGLGILMATTQVPAAIDQMLEVKPGITGAATPDIGSALGKIPIIGSFL